MSDSKSAVAKKPGKDVNKSEEIRKIATSMKAEGKKPRPVTIIDALKKRGIVVSSPQISMVLKRMGFRPRKRRTAGGLTGASLSTNPANKGGLRGGTISVEDLLAAKKVANTFGGADRAIAALSALKRFED
ncbi:MAG: hypothetical protein ACKOYJ_06695 [Planctomycetia bacterium]